MGLNWMTNEYFSLLMQRDKRAHGALELFVDDIHAEKDKTISRFLCHSGSEDFLWGLVHLLGNNNSRVAGNAAYILGTLAESEMGSLRVISLTASSHPESRRILLDLTNMLAFDDSESVMNAAGTMGTLVESHEGRSWMLGESCLETTISHVTNLLSNENLWTASNAALVLARLTISEDGCLKILKHSRSENILSRLIASLGVDEAGRGMNSAFAIGRLCDMESGRRRLLALAESEKMISQMARMLCCSDPGASKNACFAISCLATNNEGHGRLLKNVHSDEVLKTLAELLSSEDSETGWFAAMTLRTLASQPKGCLRLRDHTSVLPALKAIEARSDLSPDLKEEVGHTVEILKRLEKPSPPEVEVLGSDSARLTWSPMGTKSGFPVRYFLQEIQEGVARCVYQGSELSRCLVDLQPHRQYSYRLRAYTDGDDSPFSDPVLVTTEESVPGPPVCMRVLGCTTTQLKVGWEPPECTNGAIKSYYVYNGKSTVDHTQDLCSIISGLQPSTTYEISVCAATSKGKGSKETITGTTSELGAHAPSKPEVTVRGRSEVNVSWRSPEVPLGRISRYDLSMNGEVVYSGTDLHYVVRGLKPYTEYTFTASAITSEGRCESRPTKKRTAKDEWEGERAPLYQTPKKDTELEKKDEPYSSHSKSSTKKRKSGTDKQTPSQDAMLSVMGRPRVNSATSVKSLQASRSLPPAATQVTYDDLTPPVTSTFKRHSAGNIHEPLIIGKRSDPPERQQIVPPIAQAWEISLRSYTPEEILKAQNASAVNPPTVTQQHVSAKSRKHKSSDKESKASVHPQTKSQPDASAESMPHYLPKPDKSKILPKPRPSVSGVRVTVAKSLSKNLESSNTDSGSDDAPSEKQQQQQQQQTQTKTTWKSQARSGSRVPGDDLSNTWSNVMLSSSARTRPEMLSERDRSVTVVNIGDSKSTKDRLSSGHHRGVNGTVPEPHLDTGSADAEADDASARSMCKQEVDPSWMAHIRRSNLSPSSLSKMVSSSPTPGHFRTMTYPASVKAGVSELDGPLYHTISRSSPNPPTYLQRANTFMASHRPQTRKQLEKLSATKLPLSSTSQWQPPDLPGAQHDRNHGKFVPMQFRTQPANLPGTIKRQATSMQMARDQVPLQPIEGLSRSKTDIGFKGVTLDPSPLDSVSSFSSLKKHRDRSLGMKSASPTASHSPLMDSLLKKQPSPTLMASPRSSGHPRQQEPLMSGLAVATNHTPEPSTMQSAR